MSYILPAMNTLWFCFPDEKHRRQLHGTPADCMRKFEALESIHALTDGIEIFLLPERLAGIDQFESWFYKKFSRLAYTAVHIAGTDPDFLMRDTGIEERLRLLGTMMERLEASAIIVHAHHFRNDIEQGRRRLAEALPGVTVCIENNGFDNEWGYRISSLREIFRICPEYRLCLDLCHVKDLDIHMLDDFFAADDLMERVHEIHYSYSTHRLGTDPYAARGFPGYEPYHALWSVLGLAPSRRTRDFVRQFPVVLEGVVPPEDTERNFLKQEIELLR